eukprot:401791_1
MNKKNTVQWILASVQSIVSDTIKWGALSITKRNPKEIAAAFDKEDDTKSAQKQTDSVKDHFLYNDHEMHLETATRLSTDQVNEKTINVRAPQISREQKILNYALTSYHYTLHLMQHVQEIQQGSNPQDMIPLPCICRFEPTKYGTVNIVESTLISPTIQCVGAQHSYHWHCLHPLFPKNQNPQPIESVTANILCGICIGNHQYNVTQCATKNAPTLEDTRQILAECKLYFARLINSQVGVVGCAIEPMIMPLNNVIITLFQIETIREILLPNYYKHRKETMAHLMGFLFHRMIIQSDHIFNIEPYIEYVTKCLQHYSLRMDSEDMFNS